MSGTCLSIDEKKLRSSLEMQKQVQEQDNSRRSTKNKRYSFGIMKLPRGGSIPYLEQRFRKKGWSDDNEIKDSLTASATPEVSIAAESLVYIRRSAKKKKDKGKAIVIEDESVQKKSKKQLEQERIKYAEIAKQLQEEYDKAGKKEAVTEVDIAHVIDWNDPSVIRPSNLAWSKEKVMLVKDLESGMVLDEEQMAFLADNGDTITTGQQSQEISTLTTFQPDDLDAFDSDCDEAPSASTVLMAKLSSYDSKVLSEVPIHDNYLDNHMIDQNVQEIQYSKQPVFNNETDIDITSDSNMISYEQYPKQTENVVVQDTSTSTQQDAMIMSVIEEMSSQVAKCNEVDKVIVDKNAKVADFENQIHLLKQQLNATVESHKTLSTTVGVLKMESKAKEDKYLDEIIDLEKKNKALDNVIYK
ncbi:hypothetical protein Tco_0676810 [Tanacetum coccineum]